MNSKKPLFFIIGPTASGKTSVSIELAKRMNAEIVSADSIQVYKGLDIGSAKPTEEERKGIVHHLMGIAEPDEPKFSVARFHELAEACIADIHRREKQALVVGGTGLYVNSLTYPLDFTGAAANDAIREKYAVLEEQSPGAAHALLQKVDPASAQRLHPNDKKRVIRALEVFELTGKPISENGPGFTTLDEDKLPYRPCIAGLTMPRELLYHRIELRVDMMIAQGLVEEVEKLVSKGYTVDLPSMQGLGYKELIPVVKGEKRLSDAVEDIKRETRRFAKRQITWFKRDQRIRWFDITHYADPTLLADDIELYFRSAQKGESYGG